MRIRLTVLLFASACCRQVPPWRKQCRTPCLPRTRAGASPFTRCWPGCLGHRNRPQPAAIGRRRRVCRGDHRFTLRRRISRRLLGRQRRVAHRRGRPVGGLWRRSPRVAGVHRGRGRDLPARLWRFQAFKDLYATAGVRRFAVRYDIEADAFGSFERKPGVWDPLIGLGWHTQGRTFEWHAIFEGGGFGAGSDVDAGHFGASGLEADPTLRHHRWLSVPLLQDLRYRARAARLR